MSVYKRGGTWWYKFRFEGRVIRESAKGEPSTPGKPACWLCDIIGFHQVTPTALRATRQ